MARTPRAAKAAPAELTDSLDFLIRDTRLRLYKYIDGRIAQAGFPLRLWFPLRALYRNEGITQRMLGRLMGYGDAHAGVIVKVMQRRRLVYRQPSPTDKRKINLYLTPEGRKFARIGLRHMQAVNRKITAGFSATEARLLRSLLLRARDNLNL
ncbi:MAG TPA: MarR family winged helix-turn-helix transcriptional regulator [Stellaceae bacterium]|nr:MarR family winged helix-turn-helix transcriptional regulator [Stellaceae bacterium]